MGTDGGRSSDLPFHVEADFRRDWVDYLRKALRELRCHVDPSHGAEKLATAFFNASSRRIPAQPRSVLRSGDFGCPAAYKHGLDQLIAKVERGHDLTPHLSTGIERNADPGDHSFNDGLLNDWGIHHLHLGTATHPKYPTFVSRTDDVLFARATEDAFYMIAIMPHRDARNRGNWACQRLVHVIHRDWPESIAHLRLPFAAVDPVLTDDDVAAYRKAGIMAALTMSDGTIYGPLGGGVTTSRVGAGVADSAAYFTHAVSWIERDVRKNVDMFATKAAELGYTLSQQLRFRFVAFMPGGKAYVIEDNSKIMFCLSIPC